MRILVTGGAGFIGSNLAHALAAQGHDVVVVDNFMSGAWGNLARFRGDLRTLDIADEPILADRIDPCQIIFHQASITDTTVTDQRRMMHNNVEGFRNILETACRWESRVVWASSASVYGQGPAPMSEKQDVDPLNPYAFSKAIMEPLAERYAAKLKKPIVGLRYFNVYGPGEDHKGKFASMIHQLARQMLAGRRPRIFTDGEQRRDFVYVQDVVRANLLAAEAAAGGVYNVGSGRAESFNEVVRRLNEVLRTNLQPDYFENPYTFTQDWTEADLSASKKNLGYEAKYPLAEGIAAYHATGKLGIQG